MTVPGEVQQEQVVAVPVDEERGQPPPDPALVSVNQLVDLEAADRRVAQHAGQCRRVHAGGAQPGERRVPVGGVRDHQRGPRAVTSRNNSLGDLLSNRHFVGFCLLIAATWFVLYLPLPLASNFLSEERKLTLSQIG